ncbi:MAG TPA: HAD-IIIC family phosphatase, partial [Geminicoccaceae bacterium]
MELSWLPEPTAWSESVAAVGHEPSWEALVALANTRLDATRTNQLDRLLRKHVATPPPGLSTRPVRLAVLASSTVSHLLPAIRLGALRRGIWLETYEAPYGAYRQDLLDPASGLHAFAPDAILFAFDTPHLTRGVEPAADQAGADAALAATLDGLRDTWARARAAFGCQILQQTLLPTALPLLGANEHRLPGSPARATALINASIRTVAAEDGVDLLALDDQAARHGVQAWHDPVWWLRAKQAVGPAAAPLFGDLVARSLAARQGLSRKCLVLDLDNTLWGGVVGDDGVAGLVLGHGSAEGEAYLGLQSYARDLARRGIILAVVSKNDEANAIEVFERHPEMVLRRRDIAAFLANWDDKAQNLRRVAAQLGIGLDALVFVDDNPFERELVRSELPMVAVPELPEDAALYALRIADAGYFDALAVTDEDRARSGHYAANEARNAAAAEAADLPAYLAGLDMRLLWKRFDRIGLPRIVQLVNKTNQFNLTTHRTTEAELLALMAEPEAVGLQFRLVDRLGDNGMIGVVMARVEAADLRVETWLMSCRVLGRGVEAAMLAVIAAAARSIGAGRLIGLYRPSPKNA